MSSLIFQKRWSQIIFLIFVIILGALLRLNDLGIRTIGHIEIYIPGIELPPVEYSDPPPRLTLLKSITNPIADEVHPPGYYIFMFAWTKLFGTGVLALRLPSALFGIASILLIFQIASIEGDRWVALLAAGMLALNGHQIYWSQLAKMYSLACFLGLLSTWLLLSALRGHRYSRLFQVFYVLSTLAGLGTVFYFWFLFIIQILWVSIQAITKKDSMPGILRLQFLTFILASPFLSIAIFQSRRPSYFDPDMLAQLVQFLQFGFLFEKDYNAVSPTAFPMSANILLFLLAIFLLIYGLISNSRGKSTEWEFSMDKGPSGLILISTGILCFLIILGFTIWTYGNTPTQTPLVLASSFVPLLIPLADLLLHNYWSNIIRIGAKIGEKMPFSCPRISLISLQAIVPAAVIVIISPIILLFSSRTSLLFTPYLLILIAIGLVSLIQNKRIWIILVPILAIIFSLSVIYYRNAVLEHPTDYKGLAEQWIPDIEETDLIFIQRHWATTPIFYYLNFNQYNFVAWDYEHALSQNPDARIWVLSFKNLDNPLEMANALQSYENFETIEALRIQSRLFVK